MTEALQAELLRYLRTIAGDQLWFEPVEQPLASKLPLFLQGRYQIYRADLFGRKVFLAIQSQPMPDASATEYAADSTGLSRILSADVILVLAELPSHVRNRLVHQHVPFIVPGTQMFLPMLMIDLREQYPRRRGHPQGLLSSVAQVVVIYHLVRESLNGMPLKEIALHLNYSPTAIGKAEDELTGNGLCEVERTGKAVFLYFGTNKADVWRRSERLLSTPVRRTHWVRWGHPRPEATTAGTTALSHYSLLADDSIPTFAMRDRQITASLEHGQLIGCADRDGAQARMESWRYDPLLLSTDRKVADPCSVFLSLRHSGDERIQKELISLMDGFLK